jgi:hypothetical protein
MDKFYFVEYKFSWFQLSTKSTKISTLWITILSQYIIFSKDIPYTCIYNHKKLRYSIISSPGPKIQVNYCHHLASVVCKIFTFQASPKPLGQLEPNLAGMFLGWSSTKLLFFVPVGHSTWLPGPIICSDWLKFQRSSSLKLMNWLNPNCKWKIIEMSFTKFLYFIPIGNPRSPPPQDID